MGACRLDRMKKVNSRMLTTVAAMAPIRMLHLHNPPSRSRSCKLRLGRHKVQGSQAATLSEPCPAARSQLSRKRVLPLRQLAEAPASAAVLSLHWMGSRPGGPPSFRCRGTTLAAPQGSARSLAHEQPAVRDLRGWAVWPHAQDLCRPWLCCPSCPVQVQHRRPGRVAYLIREGAVREGPHPALGGGKG